MPARRSGANLGSLFAMNSSSFRVLSALFAIAERLYEKSRFSPRSFSFSLMTGSKMKTAMKPNQIRADVLSREPPLPWNPPPPPKPPPPPLLWTTNPSAMNVCGSPTRRLNTGHASPVGRHSMTDTDSTRPSRKTQIRSPGCNSPAGRKEPSAIISGCSAVVFNSPAVVETTVIGVKAVWIASTGESTAWKSGPTERTMSPGRSVSIAALPPGVPIRVPAGKQPPPPPLLCTAMPEAKYVCGASV